jgi:uncharacterized membrane-anchored protein YitT (DUF2179 family)
MQPPAPAAAPRHTAFEDLQALFAGALCVSLGVALFAPVSLMTGGTAGIAFLAHYATGAAFGRVFFLVNLPFYVFAWKRRGPKFVLKTFGAVALVSALTEVMPHLLVIDRVEPVFAAIMGGLLMGTGALILFRHGASLGGINVLALHLQDRYGWRAGYVQLAIDAAILLAAIPVVSASRVAISLIGAVVLNLTLAINHRPGRYMGI